MATFYPCITEDEVYEWDLVRFLNDLAFMKDKGEYDLEVMKQQMKHNGTR